MRVYIARDYARATSCHCLAPRFPSLKALRGSVDFFATEGKMGRRAGNKSYRVAATEDPVSCFDNGEVG